MVCHGTPVYIIEGCPPPSDRASMVTTLNVTFEHGSRNVDIQAYYCVPNGDIHCPKPWITGKVESLPPILIAIDQLWDLIPKHSKLGAEFQMSVFTTIHDLFPETF